MSKNIDEVVVESVIDRYRELCEGLPEAVIEEIADELSVFFGHEHQSAGELGEAE